MKTRIATLVIAMSLLLSVISYAKEPVPASKAVAHSVAEFIHNELDYPEFAIEEKFQGIVAVRILIEDDGTFDVKEANCVNRDMKEYVVREIENIISEKHARYAGQEFVLKINYDLKLF